MVKKLTEAKKWAEGIQDCMSKIESWLCHQNSSMNKIQLELVDELLRFNPAPCNEPHYHKLKVRFLQIVCALGGCNFLRINFFLLNLC